MQDKFSKKIINFIQAEKQFFWALAFLGVVFVVNYGLYANHKKTVESCVDGKCLSNFSEKLLSEEANISETETSQLVSDFAFSSLKESKVALGQVFQAKEPLISAVALKIDINKKLNPGSRQYVLSLREVEYDGEKISSPGPTITDLAFSISSIEKYRQADGAFLFPLFGRLEKDKYYLISLDNSKVDVSKQNYLEPLGSGESKSYLAGGAVVRKNKELTLASGDLYFKIYGANLNQENGVPILNGAKIEDLGQGLGRYSYATKGKYVDLFDLETATPGTEFSENDKVIYAPAKDNASFTYAVNTIYPISKLNFSATQLRSGWKAVKVSYSFDRQSWTDLPFSEGPDFLPGFGTISSADAIGSDLKDAPSTDTSDGATDNSPGEDVSVGTIGGTVQIFNADIVPTKEARAIYFKITYDQNDKSKGRFFALKNLKIMAELKMN